MDEKNKEYDKYVIPVIYYDIHNEDFLLVQQVLNKLGAYFERENIPFISLPKDITDLKYIEKEEALKIINEIKEKLENG